MKRKHFLILPALVLLTLALSAAGETLNEYFTCRFSLSPAVYTGPSGTYYRAGSGKAQYGSPGKARVYGEENGWLLIGYQTSSGSYRLGYIDASIALDRMYEEPADAFPRPLTFDYAPVWLARDCELTDDPVISRTPIDSLKAGQYCVYLASLEPSWAYIELRTGSEWKRGFIPMNAVDGWEALLPQEQEQQESEPYPILPPEPSEPYFPEEPEPQIPWVTPQPTSAPWNYVYPSAGFAGVWAIANQRLATRGGPSSLYPETGTYYLQAKPVLVLAKHYDEDTGFWWVKCRIEGEDGTARALWTSVRRFFNQDWLLEQLPVE